MTHRLLFFGLVAACFAVLGLLVISTPNSAIAATINNGAFTIDKGGTTADINIMLVTTNDGLVSETVFDAGGVPDDMSWSGALDVAVTTVEHLGMPDGIGTFWMLDLKQTASTMLDKKDGFIDIFGSGDGGLVYGAAGISMIADLSPSSWATPSGTAAHYDFESTTFATTFALLG